MKVRDFIKKLEKYDQEKEIKILAPNGLLLDPDIKIKLKDEYDVLNLSFNNTECYIIEW
jgi:hypothetical protein